MLLKFGTFALLTIFLAPGAHADYVNLKIKNLKCESDKVETTVEYVKKDKSGRNVFSIKNFAQTGQDDVEATVTETYQNEDHIILKMSSKDVPGDFSLDIDAGYAWSQITWAKPNSMQWDLEFDCKGDIHGFK